MKTSVVQRKNPSFCETLYSEDEQTLWATNRERKINTISPNKEGCENILFNLKKTGKSFLAKINMFRI